MPKRIVIIGILFCLNGLLALWGIVSNFIQSGSVMGELVIDTSTVQVLSLPIGIGLLLGRQWSQWWARILIVVGYVFCIASIIVAIASPENAYFTGFNRNLKGTSALPYVIVPLLALAGVLVLIYRLLYSPKTNDYLHNRKVDNLPT